MVAAPLVEHAQFAQRVLGFRSAIDLDQPLEHAHRQGELSGLSQGDGLSQACFEIGRVAVFKPGDQPLVVVERFTCMQALASGAGET